MSGPSGGVEKRTPSATEPKFVRVVAPHFVAGLEIGLKGRCVTAAPILKWTIGKHEDELRRIFAERKWKASVIDPQAHTVQL